MANPVHSKDLSSDYLWLIVRWSFPVDVLTTLALAVVPGVVVCVQPFAKALRGFLKAYLAAVSAALCAMGTADLIIYGQWGKRFGADTLEAAWNLEAVTANFSLSLTLRVAIQFLPSLAVLAFLLVKWVFPAIDSMPGPEKDRGEAVVAVPVHLVACLVAVRLFSSHGQEEFANKAMGYQDTSDVMFGIMARENPFHRFLDYVLPTLSRAPECNVPQYQRTIDGGDMLRSENAPSRRVLKGGVSRPHVVLVIGESFSSDVVDLLADGRQGSAKLTPGFDALAGEGLLFTNFYASRYGTIRALKSILTGFPLPVNHGSLAVNLPKEMKRNGYSTRFYYGGDLSMFEGREGIAAMGFDQTLGADDVSTSKADRGRWGLFDHVVFEKALQDLEQGGDADQKPSFSVVLTLSYHIPFDVPAGFKCDVAQAPEGFSAAEACGARYADDAFAGFVRRLKEGNSWKDTLVIFVADHGRHGSRYSAVESLRFKIPMLWLGGALDESAIGRVDSMGSQSDLAETLFRQLGIDSPCMKFSRDILSPHMEFAFYNDYFGNDSLAGVVQGDRYTALSCETGTTLGNGGFDKSEEIGWSYIQMLLDYRKELEARIDRARASGVGDRCVEAAP